MNISHIICVQMLNERFGNQSHQVDGYTIVAFIEIYCVYKFVQKYTMLAPFEIFAHFPLFVFIPIHSFYKVNKQ